VLFQGPVLDFPGSFAGFNLTTSEEITPQCSEEIFSKELPLLL
jgi:hypothetical protein